VLTGETRPGDLEHIDPADTPHLVLDRIDKLLPPRIWKELGWSEDDGP
jgi:hypothetical protein